MASTKKQRIKFDVNNIEVKPSEEDKEDHALETNVKINRNKLFLFSVIFCFKTLGMINYICDVGSDILNAFDYLLAQKEWPKVPGTSDYNYTRAICDDWESYQHPKMGILTLCIVFLPPTIGVLFLGTVYLLRSISTKLKQRHDEIRLEMGLTADNVRIVRFSNWVERGSVHIRLLKGVLLFLLLCVIFCLWQFIVVYILVSELYYLYKFCDYRNDTSNQPSTRRVGERPNYRRRQSNAKADLNKEFAQSTSMLLRITETGTESILQLMVQLYIAIYNDFTPGPLQYFTMFTSFASLVFGTFYWNSEFPWDRKYQDGIRAIPLYMLSIAYKCLSITTIFGVLSIYGCIPIIVLIAVLAVIYYSLIRDNTFKNMFNILSVYMRDIFHADDKKYLRWFAYEAIVSSVLHTTAMIIFGAIWTQEEHNLFDNLNDCAKNSLRERFPLICVGVAGMAITHLVLTLIYVKYFPHVWDLDPKRRQDIDNADCNYEFKDSKVTKETGEENENDILLKNKRTEEDDKKV